MTEEEWLTSDDPALLMCGLKGRISTRQYDRFAIACAERTSAAWPDPVCREYLDFVESEAEGHTHADEEADRLTDAIDELISSAWDRVEAVFAEPSNSSSRGVAIRTYNALALLGTVRGTMEWWFWLHDYTYFANPATPSEAEQTALLSVYRECLPLLRCIIGNPFRPVACDPSWRTSTAVGLAEGIYADHAFDRLPILADALEEAGCDIADILAHCRGDGPHARGCWVVDLVLGKA